MVIYDIQNAVLLDIAVDDTSIRSKVLNGENTLTLNYALAEHKEIPLGAWCVFKGERYSLMSPEDITMNHRRSFEYTLTMHSEDAKAKLYKFINPVDGRLKFSLTAKPVEHLQMFVDNMNKRDSGWTIGECPDHVEVVLSYNHTTCHDALVQLANELELDYWFVGKSVSIGKLELNKDNPLPLSYGGDGAGLKPNIKRNNYAEALPVEILYTQGSETNIDRSKYGASELHLPKSQSIRFDGVKFEGEAGFDVGKARSYIVDGNGYSVKRSDKTQSTHSEDSLDCTEIYPAKEEEVVGVEGVNDEKHFYDIHFDSKVNYSKYLIAGETPRVIFQSGMLAGKEFDLAKDDKGNLVYEEDEQRGTWKVELCPKEEDGITMPDKASGYMPAAGDKFKVFGIQLPEEYICDNATKTTANGLQSQISSMVAKTQKLSSDGSTYSGKAVNDGEGNNISETYAKKTELPTASDGFYSAPKLIRASSDNATGDMILSIDHPCKGVSGVEFVLMTKTKRMRCGYKETSSKKTKDTKRGWTVAQNFRRAAMSYGDSQPQPCVLNDVLDNYNAILQYVKKYYMYPFNTTSMVVQTTNTPTTNLYFGGWNMTTNQKTAKVFGIAARRLKSDGKYEYSQPAAIKITKTERGTLAIGIL